MLSNGAVEKEVVVLDDDADDGRRRRGERPARRNTSSGRRLAELAAATYPGTRRRPRRRASRASSCEALAACVAAHHGEPLYVGGASRLAAEHDAFVEHQRRPRLLELLEQHVVLASLMRELLGPGLTVRIGSENELADLRECSLVLAPYLVEGETVGTVGVLGPTRMDYRKAQAAVTTVSQQLGRQLLADR